MRFGARLRKARVQRHLSQEALAEALGTSPKSISRWENDQVLPHAYYRLRLCRFFGLSQEELFVESAELDPAPVSWNVSFPRHPFFTGREEILQTVHALLTSSQSVALTQAVALSGLGGIGKTQGAIEYAYRYGKHYRAIFFLAAETDESLQASLQQIANQLQLPERQEAPPSQLIAAVQRWLATHRGWLLIADNVEDLDRLQPILPGAQQGALLLTTRSLMLGPLAHVLELPAMSSQEGVALLLRRARCVQASAPGNALLDQRDTDAAVEVVHLLERLPLALDQAGAYIEETGCSVQEYLQRYHDQRKRMLARRGLYAGTHPDSVTATLLLSLEQVERRHQAATDLLRLAAFLAPEAIPEELLMKGAQMLGPVLCGALTDPYHFDQALAALRSASLVTRHSQVQMLSVHRLVQAVLQDQMESVERQRWCERAMQTLNLVPLSPDSAAQIEHGERYLPHIQACLAAVSEKQIEVNQLQAADLCYKAGVYQESRGRYQQASVLLAQALAFREQMLGLDHPDLVPTISSLALSFQEKGDYGLAETLYQRALQMREANPREATNPSMADILSDLALCYWRQGNYEQSELLYLRALPLLEQEQGQESGAVGIWCNNLALLYREMGRYEQAHTLFLQALPLYERFVGPEHPNTAVLLTNLGNLYRALGKYEEAEPLYLRALAIFEELAEPEHRYLSYSYQGLGHLYLCQGKSEQAEHSFRRALRLRERMLGEAHPDTAASLQGLGLVHARRGDYEQAVLFYQQAFPRFQQALGTRHLRTKKIGQEYAEVLCALGRQQEAAAVLESTT
jgi:tetratricopeptide (TPR) repeat protein/transcriptional regulator with XRE-family HTH domain